MKIRTLPVVAAVALFSLTACGQSEPEVVDSRAPDPMAEQLKNAAPVELPPSIKANATFRCQPGNTLVYVDFFEGDKQANLRTEKAGAPTALTAANAGEPLTGGGYSVTGNSKAIEYKAPDGSSHTCKA